MFSLENKTIVLFGRTGLIGSALYEAMREAGAKVYAPPRQGPPYMPGYDIRDEKMVSSYLHGVKRRHGSLDGVVNAAWPKDSTDHIEGFYNVTMQGADAMETQPLGGSIVNLGSIYGKVRPDKTMYDGTEIALDYQYWEAKTDVHTTSKLFAVKYAPHQVRINVVAPGGIFNGHSDRFVKQYSDRTPMGRMGKPEDVTGAVLFLLSDASSYITGQVIFCDGGFTL